MSVLDRIVEATRDEVERRREIVPLSQLEAALRDRPESRPFQEALTRPGVSVIAESNFDSKTDLAPFRRLADEREMELVQVHVTRETEELLGAFAERAEGASRHPGHGDSAGDVDEVRERLERGDWDALDLPGELVRHDTTGGDKRVAELVARLEPRVAAS